MRPYYQQRPQKEQDRKPSRTRGALGLFFNPNFGTSLGLLRDTGYMFIQLIALIFAQADLIDKRHPVIINQKARYTLLQVIQLAYQRVEWRQENISQIALFLGVCSCMLVCALGLLYALMSVALNL